MRHVRALREIHHDDNATVLAWHIENLHSGGECRVDGRVGDLNDLFFDALPRWHSFDGEHRHVLVVGSHTDHEEPTHGVGQGGHNLVDLHRFALVLDSDAFGKPLTEGDHVVKGHPVEQLVEHDSPSRKLA